MDYIQKELTEAFLSNAAAGPTAQLLDHSLYEPAKAWMMIREIIRIVPKSATSYSAIAFSFYNLLIKHGEFVIRDLETEGASNNLLNQCLKYVLNRTRTQSTPTQLSPALISRIKNLYHLSTNRLRAKPFRKRDLPNSMSKIVSAWCVYSQTFWAFDQLMEMIGSAPGQALDIIVDILNNAPNDEIISIVAAGPLESLLVANGIELKEQIHTYAIFNNNLRTALARIWLDPESDDFYPYWENLMEEFNFHEALVSLPFDEDHQ